MRAKIREFAQVVNGSTPSTNRADYYDGNIIWFTPKDLSDQNSKYIYYSERCITQVGYDSCSTQMIPAGNLLMSSRAPIGLLAINKRECCTNQGFKSFIVDETKCLVEYLYYYLKYHIKEVEALGSGTTFKEVSKNSIENYDIELPSLVIQNNIVSILKNIDDKIANNNAINAELEAMAKTIYDYWFLQFEFPDENGKPYKSSGGKMVYNEELKREIPEGWSIDKISSVAMLYQPQTISENEMMANGKYFVYGANGIVGKYHSFNHESNEIAICCRGASCGQFIMTQPLAWITGNAMVVKPTSFCGREYLFYGLSYKTIAPYITGSAQPQITRTNLENMRVLIPHRETVDKFEQFALEIRAKTQMIFAENQELASFRDFLLPLLMNGQVGFKEDV